MEPIITHKERCRRCYSCVRSCPVKAIKVDGGFAEIIHERCIGCGNCLSCPQNAKVIIDKTQLTKELLISGAPVFAVLGCSFPAYFSHYTFGQLVHGLKKLGFSQVHEGAIGAEMITDGYVQARKSSDRPLISSHCPAVVDLLERHYPKLIPHLIPIVSPMIAIGRALKEQHGADTRIVYISSCIAAKFEIQAKEAGTAIDVVLTPNEIEALFKHRGIEPTKLDELPFDGIPPTKGRLFSLDGGPLKLFGINHDVCDTETVSATGETNIMEIISDLASGRITPEYTDLRFCSGGCVDGPLKNSQQNHFFKQKLIVGHCKAILHNDLNKQKSKLPAKIDIERTFADKSKKLPSPTPEDIRRILHATNKFVKSDELNCRACGYATCREHAVAVFQGLADIGMCLPHNLQQGEEERGKLLQHYELIKRELDRKAGDEMIVGNDPAIKEILGLIAQVGPTPTTVLIRGETGTGKELTARAIHRASIRCDKPLITVNCTTITDSLLESELFGSKKGAFTGATADKKGLFETADGGTIFLDEIGDISPKLQAELLRMLDLGEIRPVGSTGVKKVDVRLIAATNKDLEQGVRDGWFREDLYYRLNVFFITLPPLRDRIDSIPALVHHFMERARTKLNKTITGIDDRAIKAMQHYPWPGNIREMQNVIERSSVLAKDSLIHLENLPTIFTDIYLKCSDEDVQRRHTSFKAERERHLGRTEKNLLSRYLDETGGNVAKAARLANIPRRTFYRLLQKHGITVSR